MLLKELCSNNDYYDKGGATQLIKCIDKPVCYECYYDLQTRFTVLAIHIKRSGWHIPKDILNVILKYMVC